MLTQVLLFVGGLVALIAGAEALVRGASRLALAFGVSPLVIGLTIVAFGTSSPETAVSVGAVLSGSNDIAVGSVVGSNIFNVLVILGLSALVVPLAVHSQIIRQEVPIMIGAAVLLLVLVYDERVGRLDGLLLLVLLLVYTTFLVWQSRRETQAVHTEYAGSVERGGKAGHWGVQVVLIVVGLALLVLGSDWLVDAALVFARVLVVSDLVIGLTIIAAGTSLPEVATSLLAAIRGERDIAVGNVVGSSTFNILGCLGITSAVAPAGLSISPAVMNFDLWVMIAVMVACLPVFVAGRRIGRIKGLAFVAYYVAYVVYLILAAQQHDALPAYSRVLFGFVVPLTVVTLVAMVVRDQNRRMRATKA